MADDASSILGLRQRMADAIRVLSMDAVHAAKSGHQGMPLGMADVATVLWTQVLKFDASRPDWPDRDRFVLSAGHGSMLLYALLHLTGFADMPMEEIRRFRQLGSKTPGHPEYGHTQGVETTTGPLGQGIATAVGMAMAEAHLGQRFGRDLVDHRTWVIAGDGCLMEGVSHEAIHLAGRLKLAKLTVLFDDNNVTIDGAATMAETGDQAQRFAAAGWAVRTIDGHDRKAIEEALAWAQQQDRPSLIACKTKISKGAGPKEGDVHSHGYALFDKEIAAARAAMGWTAPPFVLPDDVTGEWRKAGARGASVRAAWEQRLAKHKKRAAFEAALGGELSPRALGALAKHAKSEAAAKTANATRVHSGAALAALTPHAPEMLAGSADLTGSNNTYVKGMQAFDAPDYAGTYVHYGVREHGMAAAMNGMALHGGIIPYSGTFLTFSDYSRPAIRLGALMGVRVVHVMTHDSIGLGEDGPTHQPVEHLASLRAIPNLYVFRPADAVETAEAWSAALARKRAPSVMALSRQGVPAVRERAGLKDAMRGAYELLKAQGGAAKVSLFATGTEVSIAAAARELLQAQGVPTRVVSCPCFELFLEQDEAYRAKTIGRAKVRVGVEAAVRQGWDVFLRAQDGFVGMSSFGASAPAKDLYKHFGITAEAVAEAARTRLR
ncbi:MAG: transketolase [Hyphomonadaceae bacterium]